MKHKEFHEKGIGRIQSNSGKLTGETIENPMDVDAAGVVHDLREEDDEEIRLSDIPMVQRPDGVQSRLRESGDGGTIDLLDRSESGSVVSEDSATRRSRLIETDPCATEEDEDEDENKKKFAMDISYEGFAIYGHVLCLVIKKRENERILQQTLRTKATTESCDSTDKPTGQARMENFILSTQLPVGGSMV